MLFMQNSSIRILIAGILALMLVVPVVSADVIDNSPTPTPELSLDAMMASATVTRGDIVTVTGQATGSPAVIWVWVIGDHYGSPFSVTPNADGQFIWSIDQFVTDIMIDDTYTVIVQAPGNNNVFDVHIKSNSDVYLGDAKIKQFKMPYGGGSLKGEDAKGALLDALSSSESDDLYQKLSFTFVDQIVALTASPTETPEPTPTDTPTPTPTPSVTPTPTVTETPTPTPSVTVTTAVTTVPTTEVTTVITTVQPTSEPTGTSTISAEELNEKVGGLESRVNEQQAQIEEQQGIIDRIYNFLKSIFNWE